jgi:glutamyl-tRNA synthetase
MGFLPEALNAYLLRLGWSPGGDDQILSKEEAAGVFDLGQVQKAPARLDLDKLASVNAHFMKQLENGRVEDLLRQALLASGTSPWTPEEDARLTAAAPVLKARAKTVHELAAQAAFILRRRPLTLDAAAQKLMKPETVAVLQRLAAALSAAPHWTPEALAGDLKDFATAEGIGMGQFGPALRAALTGGAASPDLGQTLSILGRSEALARIADQIAARA